MRSIRSQNTIRRKLFLLCKSIGDVRYLADALRVIQTEEVVMELTNSLSPIVFTSPDEKYDYSYMVLPVRINN